eukprot:CAMPEP_0201520718 /NCGR_PEP_ID=MMETSP0161_2-20130828/12229_1 /ASSEMBLY_ACC=CAM_ASM_000251 /TAXON_ID=180227 /ORGANISM="Neoparamoeba aestuarina, Strain SoJaBio B1-5/56/2" /LENGTH=166 /DNA_ID=CAMNT_0047919187 /DNA_START=51 /DNA_END=548 /DNA_ORIENTATION=-
MFAWYGRMLAARPLLTKSVTGSVLYTAGDVICQGIDGTLERDGWQIERSSKMTFFGAFLFAPISHLWYVKMLGNRIPGNSLSAVGKKLAIDQIIFGPFINSVFLTYMVGSNGGTVEDVKNKFRNDFVDIMKMNVTVWPAAMAVNFRFVPVQFQVLYINFVVMGWSA